MLMHLRRRAGWSLMFLLSLAIVAYAGAILVTRAFPDELWPSLHVHSFAISVHIVGAILALALGPFQFLPRLRSRKMNVHRWIGRLYLLGVLAGGSSGLYLAVFSYAGLSTHIGFGSLAVLWLASGLLAYRAIRARRIEVHRRWITRNFALTFAGVMLRLWLPASDAGGIPFDVAYPVVAWFCWVPNLVVAEVLFRAWRRRQIATVTLERKMTIPRT
jgi:uncharacterized membrane protein